MPRGVKDLQRVTGLGRDLVKAGILSGQLPGYRVNTRFIVPDEAFDDFLHGRWTPHHAIEVSCRLLPGETPQPERHE